MQPDPGDEIVNILDCERIGGAIISETCDDLSEVYLDPSNRENYRPVVWLHKPVIGSL